MPYKITRVGALSQSDHFRSDIRPAQLMTQCFSLNRYFTLTQTGSVFSGPMTKST
jgi:hypothetical protein